MWLNLLPGSLCVYTSLAYFSASGAPLVCRELSLFMFSSTPDGVLFHYIPRGATAAASSSGATAVVAPHCKRVNQGVRPQLAPHTVSGHVDGTGEHMWCRMFLHLPKQLPYTTHL